MILYHQFLYIFEQNNVNMDAKVQKINFNDQIKINVQILVQSEIKQKILQKFEIQTH